MTVSAFVIRVIADPWDANSAESSHAQRDVTAF